MVDSYFKWDVSRTGILRDLQVRDDIVKTDFRNQ